MPLCLATYYAARALWSLPDACSRRLTAPPQAELIIPAAEGAPALLALDLSHNNIPASAAGALCHLLTTSKSLKVLDVCAVALGDEAFTAVADTVAKPGATLETLITDVRGGKAVMRHLKVLKKQLTKENNGVKAQARGPSHRACRRCSLLGLQCSSARAQYTN